MGYSPGNIEGHRSAKFCAPLGPIPEAKALMLSIGGTHLRAGLRELFGGAADHQRKTGRAIGKIPEGTTLTFSSRRRCLRGMT
jgi:hypothetical protein